MNILKTLPCSSQTLKDILITMIFNHLSFTIQHNGLTSTLFSILLKTIFIIGSMSTEIKKYKTYNDHMNKKSRKFTAIITEKILTWTNISVSVPIFVFWVFCNSVRIVTGFMSNFL